MSFFAIEVKEDVINVDKYRSTDYKSLGFVCLFDGLVEKGFGCRVKHLVKFILQIHNRSFLIGAYSFKKCCLSEIQN